MSSSAALGKMFGAASVALFTVAAYWTYRGKPHSHTQLVVASTAVSTASAQDADLPFPVVLPPRTPSNQSARLTAEFAEQCVAAAKFGLPSTAEVRCYGAYLASLNYERRTPNWVMEVVDHRRLRGGPSGSGGGADEATSLDDEDVSGDDSLRRGSRLRSKFYADDTVPAPFRVGPRSYTTRGLSRGHLVPAQLHKASQAEMDTTFNMSANVVPQDMTMNAVDWLRLEGMTRKISKEVSLGQRRGSGKQDVAVGSSSGSTHNVAVESTAGRSAEGGKLYVVSGPAFVPRLMRVERRADGTELHVPLPSTDEAASLRHGHPAPVNVKPMMSYALTGDVNSGTLVAVPTHLFKVFLAEEGGGRTRSVAAFLMPNGPITEQLPLTAYQVPLERLQRVTGLQFFPGLDTARLPDMCKLHNCDARPVALFQRYRDVAQLRAAGTVPQLRQTYASLQKSAAGGKLSESVMREFEKRTEELVAEAVGPIDALER
ncbi:putative mitochondrial endonuclease G [Leptomonas pyrrhocoris]|uniref:Putative mitochondrial endonuclease G n=1 Tax=Leptomonas pyrrhocoris TaxID=157538 RepID=A0A0M9FTZ2_LEPPY|nr:putative mitochondrial endonuclease G [Leptomonas pyrrhocoris]XP_015654422.1 putative mitochondrial endonuclease G [Leptomonas pyrrhocoris]KPA75982.1 putative mitochondrial endonuclease G [Leptomonas pyrrhocoris]KPA75983.1 putative mitochondrial endonuclease G [Leptomonas pyrrhocoris]|eukprot:XP_015654421.1 putative mitochondrial endonuclease G [Leptomonas pyrrhocoris]